MATVPSTWKAASSIVAWPMSMGEDRLVSQHSPEILTSPASSPAGPNSKEAGGGGGAQAADDGPGPGCGGVVPDEAGGERDAFQAADVAAPGCGPGARDVVEVRSAGEPLKAHEVRRDVPQHAAGVGQLEDCVLTVRLCHVYPLNQETR